MIRNIGVTLFMLLLQLRSLSAIAQTAEVTFYSNASLAKKLLPVAHGTAFFGYVFDGSNELLLLKRGQFATFALPVGQHDFSASLHKHPASNSVNPILLSVGEHYFFSESMM